jgi:[ribulose-bisphosphate carboxylase]/[fructose-bisphosphate aldolase]-lysine N-methyltransferase
MRMLLVVAYFFGRLFCLLSLVTIPATLSFAPLVAQPPVGGTSSWQRSRIDYRSSGGDSSIRLFDTSSSGVQQQQQVEDLANAQKVDELNALLLSDNESSAGQRIKTCKVKIGPASKHGWGLIATQDLKAGESALKIVLGDDNWEISKATATIVFQNYLPTNYDSWTGDVGLMALQLLNERVRYYNNQAIIAGSGGGIPLPQRSSQHTQELFDRWLSLLPSDDNTDQPLYPLLWKEDEQEVLQSSTTNKIYRRLDDLEEDFNWLNDNIFAKDRITFPETIVVVAAAVAGDTTTTTVERIVSCFSLRGFTWAMSMVQSRSFFLEGALRLIPLIDYGNHDDDGKELGTASTGLFGGGSKAASIVTARAVKKGDEVMISYGPKSAAEYLLEHGFVPDACWPNPVVALTVEIDPKDRFYDDKLDILEFETYGTAPMDPIQTFDVQVKGKGPVPDPALLQFLRLRALGKFDAFLLESVFRKEVWGFMSVPVSEANELAVVEYLLETCQAALDEFAACPLPTDDGTTATTPTAVDSLCRQLRAAETSVLERLVTIMEQEKQGLHLKEYYQERRLKDLGLDSVWTPEDDLEEADITGNYSPTRTPGGADYDW